MTQAKKNDGTKGIIEDDDDIKKLEQEKEIENEEIAEHLPPEAQQKAPIQQATPIQQPTQTKEPTQEEINALKESSGQGIQTARENKSKSRLAKFKNESGRMTYYYKNISNEIILFSNKKVTNWKPGKCLDFSDMEWVEKEEDIINFRDLRKLEFPVGSAPKIKRLTPLEYFQELKRQSALKNKKRDAEMEMKNLSTTPKQEEISNTVTHRTIEYLDWDKLDDKGKKESGYNAKYEYLEWVSSYKFNEEEHRYMKSMVKDGEILRMIMDRHNEIITNDSQTEVPAAY